MQGTIATFDETAHNGSILLDDGTPLAMPSAAFVASRLLTLRVGQRVKIETDAAGVVSRVTLPTLP